MLATLPTAVLVRLGEAANRTFVLPLVIFYPTSRCNSRCISCDWWKQSGEGDLSLAEIDDLAGTLPALGTKVVVFSGGEPLLQRALPQALRRVRALGFETALHTGGADLAAFRAALPLLDWVGFDFKAPFPGYAAVTGAADSGPAAEACLRLLRESGVPFEVRTTVAPGLLPAADLQAMAGTLAGLGIGRWVLQEFRAEGCRDPRLAAASRRAAPLAGVAPALKAAAPGLDIRVRPAHPLELAV